MGQITKAFADQMISHCERGEHPPLTVHEAHQLAHAWLHREQLLDQADNEPQNGVYAAAGGLTQTALEG